MKIYFLTLLIFLSLGIYANDNEDTSPGMGGGYSENSTNVDNEEFSPKKSRQIKKKIRKKVKKKKRTKEELYKIAEKKAYKRNYKKAAIFYQKACELKHKESCKKLAKLYSYDKRKDGKVIVKHDLNKTIKYYKMACELRGAYSCSYIYRNSKDSDEKKLYRQKTCDAGNNRVCNRIKKEKERKIEKKLKKEKLKKSCEAGRISSCKKLSVYYYDDGRKYRYRKDKENTEKFFIKACDLDNARACHVLAEFYDKENNKNKVRKFFKKSCDLNYRFACDKIISMDLEKKCNDDSAIDCYNLGEFYTKNGSFRTGLKFYERACELKNNKSCKFLAKRYINSHIKDSRLQAYKYYEKSCKLKDKDSCKKVEDLELFNKCNLGNALACDKVGDMYDLGQSVRRSPRAANRYYKRACELGHKKSCDK